MMMVTSSRRREHGAASFAVSSDDDLLDDDARQISRAVREARARKRSLQLKLRQDWERSSAEKGEIESLLRQRTQEQEQVKRRLHDCEYDLRRLQYELQQVETQNKQLVQARQEMEITHGDYVVASQVRLATVQQQLERWTQRTLVAKERLGRVLEKCVEIADSPAGQSSRMLKHLLLRAAELVAHIGDDVAAAEGAAAVSHALLLDGGKKGSDHVVDGAMFEMCRSLEEENQALLEQIDELKGKLDDAQRQASAGQLLPHYRLAILRARTYARNLQEQLKREQATSQSLRDQLDETYKDLKKVVEDKRLLYKKLSSPALRSDSGAFLAERDALSPSQEKSASSSSRRDAKDDGVRFSSAALEQGLKDELGMLDRQIDTLREKLGHAALAQSQKILYEVLDSNLVRR